MIKFWSHWPTARGDSINCNIYFCRNRARIYQKANAGWWGSEISCSLRCQPVSFSPRAVLTVFNGSILRTSSDLKTSSVNTVYKGDDSLRHLGPLLWQIVPEYLKNAKSLEAFEIGIKCPCRSCKEYIPGVGYIT